MNRTKRVPIRRPQTTAPGRKAPATPPHKGRSSRPSLTRGSTYEAGRVTRKAIVRAATSVLIECGHARFTIERVARRIGISPGNVNYYFPTRASLLETLIVFTLSEYRRRARSAGKPFNTGTVDGLGEMLRWLMDDAISNETNRLFRELWSLAVNDVGIARAMDTFYARSVRAHLRRLTDRSTVSQDPRRLEAIVILMHILSEGTTVLFGTTPQNRETFERVREVAYEAFVSLLQPKTLR